jgi:hypothetical protein
MAIYTVFLGLGTVMTIVLRLGQCHAVAVGEVRALPWVCGWV